MLLEHKITQDPNEDVFDRLEDRRIFQIQFCKGEVGQVQGDHGKSVGRGYKNVGILPEGVLMLAVGRHLHEHLGNSGDEHGSQPYDNALRRARIKTR